MRTIRIARRSALLATTAFAVAATPALAQEAADEGRDAPIVVTANKREQDVQQVPLAITAVSGESLELRGITEAKDLAAIAPNVSALGGTTSGAASVISIRGISTAADESQGFDSPIGMYIDGVYLARSSASTFEIADIERVEILRGPQGTLFGRNTTGGAVNFITRKPSADGGVRFKFGYGNYDQLLARASVDTGEFADSLRMTFTGLYKRRDGVVDNRLQPNDRLDPGSNEVAGFRWATTYDSGGMLTLTNIFDYTWSSGVPLPMQLAAVGSGVPFNVDPAIQAFATANSLTIAPPGPVAQYLAQASTSITSPGCSVQVSRSRIDPICLNNANLSSDTTFGDLFRLELDLGGVLIRSSTAYREWRSRQTGGDLDGLGQIRGPVLTAASTLNGMPASLLGFVPSLNPPAAPAGTAAFVASLPVPSANLSLFDATNRRNQQQFSQEIEIISDSDGPFNWVLGGFYFHEKGDEANRQVFGFILDTNVSVFNSTNFGGLAAGFQAGNPMRYRASLQDIGLSYRAKGESTAIYGQFEYRPGGKDGAFGITAGLRYTWDHKFITRTQNGATPFTTAADIALNNRDAKFDALTGNVTLDYRMTDDINFYARVAKGYRSGGFNVRETNATTVGRGGLLPFNNETIWAYEAGFKTQWGSMLRLNGSVFFNQYRDLQVTIPVTFGAGSSFGTSVGNAGKVDYTGFELEGMFRPVDNFWIDGSLGYVHKEIKEFRILNNAATPVVVDVASIREISYSPDWTANLAANLRVPIGDATATFRVGYAYTSEYFQFGDPLNNPFYRETKGDARGLVDAQVRIDGISFGGSSEVELTLWGKNLTNEEYVMRSVDFGALGFATTIYGDPATYGVTLGLKF